MATNIFNIFKGKPQLTTFDREVVNTLNFEYIHINDLRYKMDEPIEDIKASIGRLKQYSLVVTDNFYSVRLARMEESVHDL